MRTTLDIKDELLARAKRLAKRAGIPLRSVVEEGLRLALAQERFAEGFALRDCSVGDPDAPDPLEEMTSQDLRQEIYGDPTVHDRR